MKMLSYVVSVLWLSATLTAEANGPHDAVIQGWLSDEKCANGRASSGVYTATGPRCAKECVAAGRRIVLIDPNARRILLVANQSAARDFVGDRVEITGSVDTKAKSIRVASLKMLEPGVAMCTRGPSRRLRVSK